MVLLTPYLDDNQLINSTAGEEGGFNVILYSAEYALASGDTKYTEYLVNLIKDKMRISEGLYTSFPGCKEAISHDNLTGIMAIATPEIRKSIWKRLKSDSFRYDDMHPDNPEWSRIMHPRDIIFYGQLAGSWTCWLLMPILFIIFLIACRDTDKNSVIDTCGQLLLFTRCKAMQTSFVYRQLFKFFTWRISFNRLNTWHAIALYYFKNDPDHPVVKSI